MRPRTKRGFVVLLAILCGLGLASAQQTHNARGLVTSIDALRHKLVVSCEDIPGYMAPMEMEFIASNPAELTPLRQGSTITFTIIEDHGSFLAKSVHPVSTANLESEPLQAGQLSMLHKVITADATIAEGQPVPDFQLIDQTGSTVRLSRLRGKAVIITFGYSRCPNPNYCLRLSNNLGKLQQRFRKSAGSDFVLLTVGIDPEHDHGETLARYAASFHADPAIWHFLTGSVPETHRVANLFGMDFWNEEGLVTHTLHTAVIDSRGVLVANIRGNAFTAEQLGDLLERVMKSGRDQASQAAIAPTAKP